MCPGYRVGQSPRLAARAGRAEVTRSARPHSVLPYGHTASTEGAVVSSGLKDGAGQGWWGPFSSPGAPWGGFGGTDRAGGVGNLAR